MSKQKNKTIITDNFDKIITFVEPKSRFMADYLSEHYNSNFLVIYKYLTHSDLTNR